ncbi:elongator complex protein 1 [Brevipalpus obovatus]|uniref:elongator complex protein 1 n=1 Tax=Brevipalpus obovatus TaxID=246614 RepID=UPI003D9EA4E3
MENLKVIISRTIPVNVSSLICFNVDPVSFNVYTVTDCLKLLKINLLDEEVTFLHDFGKDNKDELGAAIAVEHSAENESVNIYFNKGTIISFSLETCEPSEIGCFSGGIAAVASSPDQDSTVILTEDGKLFLLNRFLDVIVEKEIFDQHPECIEPVDVGWGSKQTQFHGSEGKAASKAGPQTKLPALEWDDRKLRIVWRSDNRYFVTSGIHPEKGYRELRVWDAEGQLMFISEYVEGLEHSLSWRPEGSLIISSQTVANQHKIVCFEKNGLTHGDFSLPSTLGDFIIRHIDWSSDSKILCINGNSRKKNVLFFYHRNNYHWYLKRTIESPVSITHLAWSQSSASELYFSTSDGQFHQITFKWEIDRFDDLVAAIDGNEINFTPFKTLNIPPPMCAYSLVLDNPANELHVFNNSELLIKSNHSLQFIGPNDSKIITIKQSVRTACQNPPQMGIDYEYKCDDLNLHHSRLLDSTRIIGVENVEGSKSQWLICFDKVSQEKVILHEFNSPVIGMDKYSKSNKLAVELITGELIFGDLSLTNCPIRSTELAFKFPSPCQWIKVVTISGQSHVIGLNSKGSLYFDDKLLLNFRCTSFVIYDDNFLVLTTNDDLLLSWYLDDYFLTNVVAKGTDARDEPRSIERGAKIVSVVTEDAKIVLQMPRGNIEAIHPRTLLLHRLKELLNSTEYERAFNIMRKHRVNLNLFIDHDPHLFIENMEKIVLDVGKKDELDLCLLLSELKDEDVTCTMYSSAYHERQSKSNELCKPKLDRVCAVMRETMQKMDPNRYLIPIAVTHQRQSKPTTGEALKLIHAVNDQKLRDAAIKYLLYLTDIESLYKEALGTYDFDVVNMIVERSNKDPKEHLQYVNKLLSSSDVNYRMYRIDLDLKRFDKAIQHMKNLDATTYESECIKIIQDNRLYWLVTATFPPDHPWMPQVWSKFAEYLFSKRYYEEAGIAYERAKDIPNAIKCYQSSENWNSALALCSHLEEEHRERTIKSLALNLTLNRKFVEAAYIYENHANALEEAFTTLLQGHLWNQAFRLMTQAGQALRRGIFEEQLESYSQELRILFKEVSLKLKKLSERLGVVEKEKTAQAISCSLNVHGDDNETISDASSMTGSDTSSSKNSLSTRKSRINKRKNRKKYSDKEGHRYEHIALRIALRETIRSIDMVLPDCLSTIRWLYYMCDRELASKFQEDLNLISAQISDIIRTFWPENKSEEMKDGTPYSNPLISDYLEEPLTLIPPEFSNHLISSFILLGL